MIDHVSIGVSDVQRAKRFYDAAFAPLGYTCLVARETMLGYGREAPVFWVAASDRPVPPDLELGLHICFAAPTQASVDAFHAAAIGAGGTDHGQPGPRPNYGPDYYAAFVIDPDGYRMEAHFGS